MKSFTTTTRRLHLPLLHHLTTPSSPFSTHPKFPKLPKTPSQSPKFHPPPIPPSNTTQQPPFSHPNFTTLSSLLKDPTISPGPPLETALNQTGIKPDKPLLLQLFDSFDSSPKTVFTLFEWAEKNNGFQCCVQVFNKVVNVVGKGGDFECVWCLVLDRICNKGGWSEGLLNVDTFGIVIRRYARADVEVSTVLFSVRCWIENVEWSHLYFEPFERIL